MNPLTPRKSKRIPLACVQCRARKVKCDKKVPCKNCTNRGLSSECEREVVIVRGVVTNRPIDHSIARKGRNGLFNEKEVDNIRLCVERLTFGFIRVARLFKTDYKTDVNWPEFHGVFETIMARIDHSTSHSLCAFASYYINFIHNAVVPTLFMNEHERFWNDQVSTDLLCLVYFKPSKLQSSLPRDYYLWMSMYYTTMCNGIYFGSTELKDELDFSVVQLHELGPIFFRAAYECLCRAQFMDIPDIRTIQTYCLMSTCFHAYGSVELSQSLLAQCVGIARKLRLDQPEAVDSFPSEIKRRLWYTLCLIDWLDQMDRQHFLIGHSSVPLPALVTDDALLSGKFTLPDSVPDKENYSSVYYQRVMVEMARIKKALFRKRNTSDIVEGWTKMNNLREEAILFYLDQLAPLTDDLLSYDHARFLLFSSLTEEVLDFGRRVLAMVGKKTWAEQYRSRCIQVALENLDQASAPLPSYYRRHWIIAQHHIYAALTILLDMIMFPEEDLVRQNRRKLAQVESIFPFFEQLQATHLPAKLGLAVLPRLCKLVRFVRVDKKEGNVFEVASLRDFFDDLQVHRDPESEVIPDVQFPQYFRFEKTTQTIPYQEQTESMDGTEIQKLLADSGWSQVLVNIFGPQESPN